MADVTSGDAMGRPVSELDTPALLVDLPKLERNIATMRRIIVTEAGVNWRPHTKAIKTPELARKLLDAGARGVTCANVSAEHATIELAEPNGSPGVGDRVEFVAGYCDSTLFLHDELYGIRDGRVEAVWPILGRGKTR